MCAFTASVNVLRKSKLCKSKDQDKTRKQRIVKNGYIEVDDVSISAGYSYAEWIRVSKIKLIERENALMRIRIDRIQSITKKKMESFSSWNKGKDNHQYNVSNKILKICEYQISYTINSWNGVDLNKKASSKPYQTFREYFTVAKNWWDQKKTLVLGSVLWGPVLVEIQQFVQNKGALYEILNGLFAANVKYANTKQQPLIPNGVIKNCMEVKNFLFHLNNSLDIDNWLKQQIIHEKQLDAKQNKLRKRTGNAKIIAQQLRETLIKLTNDNNNNNNNNVNTQNIQNEPQQRQKQRECQHKEVLPANTETETLSYGNSKNEHYNQIIFDLADQFILNQNNTNIHNNTNNNNNINNNNNVINISNMNNISNTNIIRPQYVMVPLNMTPIYIPQQIQNQSIPYNGLHIGSYQCQMSGQRYNPLNCQRINKINNHH